MTEIRPPAGHLVGADQWTEINDRGQVLLKVGTPDGEGYWGVWRRERITILTSLPLDASEAADMSNRGHVVGWSPAPECSTPPPPDDDGCVRPALLARGETTSVPIEAPSDWAAALEVNDRGDVVVGITGYDPERTPALFSDVFAWRDREVVPLPEQGYNLPIAINRRGQVALGRAVNPAVPILDATVWQIGGDVTDPTPSEDTSSLLADINEAGQAAGFTYSWQAGPSTGTGFLWQDGRVTDLGPLRPFDVNERGAVAGSSIDEQGRDHAALWRDGALVALGTLGGESSVALALNDHDQVVGTSDTADGEEHAFLWQDGELVDLGALAGAETRSTVFDINNRGQIVGTVDGRPVVWTVPARG